MNFLKFKDEQLEGFYFIFFILRRWLNGQDFITWQPVLKCFMPVTMMWFIMKCIPVISVCIHVILSAHCHIEYCLHSWQCCVQVIEIYCQKTHSWTFSLCVKTTIYTHIKAKVRLTVSIHTHKPRVSVNEYLFTLNTTNFIVI